MAQPMNDVHVAKVLSEYATQYKQDQKWFISNQVAPMVNVEKTTDKYFVYDRNAWRVTESARLAGDKSNKGIRAKLSTDQFYITEHALHDYVPWRTMNEQDAPVNQLEDAVTDLSSQLMIEQDQLLASRIYTTTGVNSSVSITAATKWDATTTSAPITDMDTGIDAVAAACGMDANVAIMGKQVWIKLKRHSTIVDLIKYTQKGIVTTDLVAALFNLDNIYIGGSIQMGNDEGISSDSVAYIWGKRVVLAYSPSQVTTKSLSYMKTFALNDLSGLQVRQVSCPTRKSDMIEVETSYDMKIVNTACGYLIVDPVV